MATSHRFYARMRDELREQVLDTTAALVCAEGWGAVTMSRVATSVGVSRQHLYSEIGGKAALGEAVVTREADRFLAGVRERLRAHGADAEAGIAAAVDYVLRTAADDPLVKAILVGAHGGDTDLLPLLATRPEPVLQRAVTAVRAEAADLYAGLLEARSLAWLSEIVVRVTLSHLTQPTGPVEDAVAQIRFLVTTALAGSGGNALS